MHSSIGNGDYLGRQNAGFRDHGTPGKVASLAKNDDHVHMRRCAHQFGIEAEAIARASSMKRVWTVMLWLEAKNILHLPDPRAAVWGITQYDLGTMAQTPPHWLYVPGKHLKPDPLPAPQYPHDWPPGGF